MTPKLQLTPNVITWLGEVKQQREGAVYGTMYNNTLLVLGVSVDVAASGEGGADPYHQLQSHFPTEIDFCGAVLFTDETNDIHVPPSTLEVLKEVIVTDNPLVLKRGHNSSALKAYFYCNEKLVEAEYEVISEADICQQFVHVRLRAQLPFTCEPDPASIQNAINNLQKKVSSGTVAFHVTRTKVYLFGTEKEDSSTETCQTVGELFHSVLSPDNKNRLATSLQNIEVMNAGLLQRSTRDRLSEEARVAPVIHHLKCMRQSLELTLPVDHLALVHAARPLTDLYSVLVDTLCRSLRVLERAMSQGHKRLAAPHAHHFLPPPLSHFFTLVYLSNRTDNELERQRDLMHRALNLPRDRPLLRRGNAHYFREDAPNNGPLVNPHEGLATPVEGGEVSVVYGKYSYHHYLQDNMQDDGWGCAYRSLQTVVSWFRHQGYTDRRIPSHREIQQCLVDIKDKPASFVGSRQWIGSLEVSFCLETMLGVTSRVLSVASGAELADVGPELARHFNIHGTPIMIGGGVLAHTILGVSQGPESTDLRFLVLDPHYTGADDLRTVQHKGWVAWKKPDFWNKSAHYNLCMPLRPVCF